MHIEDDVSILPVARMSHFSKHCKDLDVGEGELSQQIL
jgi:hypothetical protein